MFNRNMLLQAIFAVLKVTPHIARLSEQVLSDGIMLFFQQQKMIPLGISMDCMGALAGKIACGLRKCVTKFTRTLKDAPQTSKLKNLTNLKQRLQKLPPQLDHAECDSQVSADSVEMLLDAAVPGTPEGVLEKAAAAKPKLDLQSAKLSEMPRQQHRSRIARLLHRPGQSTCCLHMCWIL